mmetsp:Transcript_532/g.1094  ORF Transcript_532/g.1094 Transcript_532/m.1094 type:complete len:193 (-) Transcript_532:208-786(-)|eukprot:CAMPEP_0171341220 /NCGR_PEP_ID=MMETSP0878-20121228/9665_1 /TAXON_ID=67004 /ORGANISM="Thalassiosira weissflogii, Strain CCMP1336" /LENGTH=192 /DNA_ID=CAMNT_0011843397 /DNA_START=132 /DNA_END=710 /DNA_ORIENTATION=+
MRAYFGLCLAFSLAKSSHADSTNDLGAQFFDAVQNDDIARAARLLKDGADINTQSPGGLQTPLMQSVLSGYEDMVQFLLSKGADTTIPEKDGYTPMHGAGFQGRAKIAAMLLNHGVGLRDKHPKDGYEPAVRACWGSEPRHTETLDFFLQKGVPIDDIFEDCLKMTPNQETKHLLLQRKEFSKRSKSNRDEL